MKLSDLIKKREVKIPDTDLIVAMREDWPWFAEIESREIKNTNERGKYLLSKIIISWNLMDDGGKPLPITEEIIGTLPTETIMPIIAEWDKIMAERNQKKKT